MTDIHKAYKSQRKPDLSFEPGELFEGMPVDSVRVGDVFTYAGDGHYAYDPGFRINGDSYIAVYDETDSLHGWVWTKVFI